MRIIRADIGDAPLAHKLLTEFCQDAGVETPRPDFWLYSFAYSDFFCLVGRHGRGAFGMVWGRFENYYLTPRVRVEGFFIRRGFRKKLKFIKFLRLELDKFLNENEIGESRVLFHRPKKVVVKKKSIHSGDKQQCLEVQRPLVEQAVAP